MITPLLKYVLVVTNPQLQALILVALILSSRSRRTLTPDQTTAALFIVQANCINIAGIMSLLSGMSLPLVILIMTAQGAYLIIDAHRTLPNRDLC